MKLDLTETEEDFDGSIFDTIAARFLNGWSLAQDGWALLVQPEPEPESKVEPLPLLAAGAALRAPRRQPRAWGGFVHLLARNRMNYRNAVLRAAKRRYARSVDIDTQRSRNGTPWALHWGVLGKNKLHDPKKHYGKKTRISTLTDAELGRMEYSDGTHPYKLITMLLLAASHNVRVEVESKCVIATNQWLRLLDNTVIRSMLHRGNLQVKTLAAMKGSVGRLSTAHAAGIPTILSFTGYRGRGLPKHTAWHVVDYVRGRARWSA